MSIELIECTSAREMVTELDPAHERWAKDHWRHDWIFRGQPDSNWRLVPSALRSSAEHVSDQIAIARELGKSWIGDTAQFLQEAHRLVATYDPNHASELLVQLYAEIRNLREFFELADSLNLNSSIPIPSDFHVFGTDFAKNYIFNMEKADHIFTLWGVPSIAIAQHHGVATRLLDWTKNPLYAAFFAGEGIPQGATHIAVYAIHTFFLHGERDEVRLVEVNKGNSTYIHAQEGVFTLDTRADIEFLRTGVWRSILDAPLGDVYKITLPASEVGELLRLLWLKRVTKAHMMPTLDNVILALNAKWKWQQNKSGK